MNPMPDERLLCVTADRPTAERIRNRLGFQGIAARVVEADVLLVLEFGGRLKELWEVWVASVDHAKALDALREMRLAPI